MYSAYDFKRIGGIVLTIKHFPNSNTISVTCTTEIGTEIEHLSKKFTALAQDVEDNNKLQKAIAKIKNTKHPCVGVFGEDMADVWSAFDRMRIDGQRKRIVIGQKEKLYSPICEGYSQEKIGCCANCAELKVETKRSASRKLKRKRNYDCQRSPEQR